MGPQWSSVGQSIRIPARLTRPNVGFRPTMPQHDAGQRIEPPVSVPGAAATMPDASAAPDPPLEPPGTRVGSCGFLHEPKCGFWLVVPQASSWVASLATVTAPAAANRATTSASRSGTWSRKSELPYVVVMPPVSIRSFQPTGTPASGPGSRPSASARSTAAASRRARSSVTRQTAPSSSAASFSRCSSSTSLAVRSRPRTCSAMTRLTPAPAGTRGTCRPRAEAAAPAPGRRSASRAGGRT